MEFAEVVARRRMVRRFDPEPLDPRVLSRVVRAGLRGPSAGFSQGLDLLVLTAPEDRSLFWETASDRTGPADAWRRGVGAAPALVVVLADPGAYRGRYARPDKTAATPVPYWDVDAGMAALLLLLSAVDEGLGALFFGVPGARHDAVRRAFDVPDDRRVVGVVALGRPAPNARVEGGSSHRRRRPADEMLHAGRFGRPPGGRDSWGGGVGRDRDRDRPGPVVSGANTTPADVGPWRSH